MPTKVIPGIKKVAPAGPVKKVPVDTVSAWGSPQEQYTRGCMLLFFHKVVYEHRSAPAVSDVDYDRLERYVEKLEAREDVEAHPQAPTHKRTCPNAADLPAIVQRWLDRYDETGKPPAMPEGLR